MRDYARSLLHPLRMLLDLTLLSAHRSLMLGEKTPLLCRDVAYCNTKQRDYSRYQLLSLRRLLDLTLLSAHKSPMLLDNTPLLCQDVAYWNAI